MGEGMRMNDDLYFFFGLSFILGSVFGSIVACAVITLLVKFF